MFPRHPYYLYNAPSLVICTSVLVLYLALSRIKKANHPYLLIYIILSYLSIIFSLAISYITDTAVQPSSNKLYFLYSIFNLIAILKGLDLYLYFNNRLGFKTNMMSIYLSLPAVIAAPRQAVRSGWQAALRSGTLQTSAKIWSQNSDLAIPPET